MSDERFNDVGPLLDKDGDVVMEIETGDSGPYDRQVGKLWTGGSWLTVAEARELRAWLDRIIPS